VLWVTTVAAPKDVDKDVIKRHRPRGRDLERSVVVEPRIERAGRVYRDVDALKQELMEQDRGQPAKQQK
jgi:hypothetical protein